MRLPNRPALLSVAAGKAFHLVLLGDGSTGDDMPSFRTDVDKHLNVLWSVTPPTAKAAGFLRRWLSLRAEDQPGPVQNVQGTYAVGVLDEPARGALELRLGDAVLLRNVPASPGGERARAGGVAGVHRDHSATGTLSLVRQDRQELSPTCVEDTAVKPGLSHAPPR